MKGLKVETVLPFVDVAFLVIAALLAMQTEMTRMRQWDVDLVRKARSQVVRALPTETVQVAVEAEAIMLNGEPVNLEQLRSLEFRGEHVLLGADSMVPFQQIVTIIDVLERCGANVTLCVQPAQP